MTYDPKCESLARYFLDDDADEKLVEELAEHIQYQIELFLGGIEGEALQHVKVGGVGGGA